VTAATTPPPPPPPAAGEDPPPAELDAPALAEWGRVTAELAAAGKLAAADRAILTLYVQTWATYAAAAAHVAEHGAVLKWSNGQPGISPFHKVAKEAAGALRGLLKDLGLTPAARGTAKAAPPPADDLDL
jgi:P27 family predicted phage terminase small subunit